MAGDPRFFVRTGPHRLAAILAEAGGEMAAGADGARLFSGIAPLQSAGPEEVSFLDNRRYLAELSKTRAGAVILRPELAAQVPPGALAVVTPKPYEVWARVAALFFPPVPPKPGIHPSAVVHQAARVSPSCEIGPGATIGAGADIGDGTVIGPSACIGEAVEIGRGCRIGAHVCISHSRIGDRVNILPGARIGQDGFGFANTATGFLDVPQLGLVLIEDDVSIGANTCIDRGSVQDTVIGAGSRLDNLVQIGHNVRLGRCCIIVAHVGISGSTILEDFVSVGGQAGLTGHLTIGRGARIGAQAGVMTDVPPGGEFLGSPAQERRDALREVAFLRRLVRREHGASGRGRAGDRGGEGSKS